MNQKKISLVSFTPAHVVKYMIGLMTKRIKMLVF